MSEDQSSVAPAESGAKAEVASAAAIVPQYLTTEIEKLPSEMKTMVSVMAGIFRSTSGPDPETAKVVAQSEMHEETCRLEGFRESLKTRDRQNERDHEFRQKRLNHQTVLSLVITAVCVGGIACGLYMLIVRKDQTLGSGLLIASFMALLSGGKSILQKDKE